MPPKAKKKVGRPRKSPMKKPVRKVKRKVQRTTQRGSGFGKSLKRGITKTGRFIHKHKLLSKGLKASAILVMPANPALGAKLAVGGKALAQLGLGQRGAGVILPGQSGNGLLLAGATRPRSRRRATRKVCHC